MRSLAKCFEMEESMKVLVVEDDNYIILEAIPISFQNHL